MRVAPSSVATIPQVLGKTLSAPAEASDVPGLIVQADLLSTVGPDVRRVMDEINGRKSGPGSTFVVVKPKDVSILFRYSTELGLLKTLLKAVTHDASPFVAHGIDAVWLIYGGLKFREALKAPDPNLSGCFWELAGLGAETLKLAGECCEGLKLPDACANGVNYLVTTGSAVASGKAVPAVEMMASSDERNAIPLAVLKAIGYSFEGAPSGLLGSALAFGSARPSLVPLGAGVAGLGSTAAQDFVARTRLPLKPPAST